MFGLMRERTCRSANACKNQNIGDGKSEKKNEISRAPKHDTPIAIKNGRTKFRFERKKSLMNERMICKRINTRRFSKGNTELEAGGFVYQTQ